MLKNHTISPQANCIDNNENDLMPLKIAQQTILGHIQALEDYQQISIENAKGRCLAETIRSKINVPAYNNAAMDGYALHHRDLAPKGTLQQLTLYDTVLAGDKAITCPPGHCVKIMTGARLDTSVDTVIMQEHCEQHGNIIYIDDRHQARQNVRLAGEDLKINSIALHKGKYLGPAEIGLLASLGITEIKVIRKLRIALISTGNEIHDIATPLDAQSIYDSNRYSLLAALDRADIEVINMGIIADDQTQLISAFNEAADHADIIISSGGVSVGAADFTKIIAQTLGQINFWKVAMKPGRPIAFGTLKKRLFFGLPGNPVAVLVSFYQLVLPALEKKLGIIDKPIAPLLKARSLSNIRKKPGRTEIQRGQVSQAADGTLRVDISKKQGAGILSSISQANAFIILAHDRQNIAEGEWVDVQLFSSLF